MLEQLADYKYITRQRMYDPVGAHIPLKFKEKIWAVEYIEFDQQKKWYDLQFNGELAVKGGQLTVVQQKPFSKKYSRLDVCFHDLYGDYVRKVAEQRSRIFKIYV